MLFFMVLEAIAVYFLWKFYLAYRLRKNNAERERKLKSKRNHKDIEEKKVDTEKNKEVEKEEGIVENPRSENVLEEVVGSEENISVEQPLIKE